MVRTEKEFHNKLVRDKIPQIIEEAGHEYEIRILSEEEFKEKVREKLVEEAKELLNAENDELVNELADVLQLIESIAEIEGIEIKDVVEKRKKKEEKRGSFRKRIFLIWSTIQKK